MLPVADLLHGHKFDHLIDVVLIEKRKKGEFSFFSQNVPCLVIVSGKLQLTK